MAEEQLAFYKIFCLINGEEKSFGIDIMSNQTVGHLKTAINKQEKVVADKDSHALMLYLINISNGPNLKEDVDKQFNTKPALEALKPTTDLSDLFLETPKERTVHILVKVPENVNRKRNSSDEDGKRRRLMQGIHSSSDVGDGDQDERRRKPVQGIPSTITPSSIKLKDIVRHAKSNVAYNRPEASRTTIPIALLHPVFAEFLENCQHHKPNRQDNQWLLDLRCVMLQRYDTKRERCFQFREIFTKHTDLEIPDATIGDTRHRTDGHVAMGRYFLLISSGNNECVHMSADPKLQAFAYYIETVKQIVKRSDMAKIFQRSPLPCLLIYYFGSVIGFAGAVTAAKPQFEPLALFDLETNQHDSLALEPIARALGAVRAALNSLKEYYTEIRGPQPSRAITNPEFPSRTYYTNHSKLRVEFDYQKRLHENQLLFLVLTREGKQKRVIKFTQKYSEEAHKHCASHGIAPALYASEKLGDGWKMIVMEYLDRKNYDLLRDSDIPRDNRPTMVKKVVSKLHEGGFVHGDIRDVNIMIRRNWNAADISGIKLFDFDWAGPDGQARYPANVNYEQIRRPQGARDGQLITKEHDGMMVDYLDCLPLLHWTWPSHQSPSPLL